jgi:beta-lactamase superfamily II metal-dependent hydrolase
MCSKKPKPYLVVLDVGHGSAAVLHDEGGTVVFDTGKGAHVGRHLRQSGNRHVQTMFLSHADADHIGGAVTLLMDTSLNIGEVLLNSDAAKGSIVFEQLRYALADANHRAGTRIERRLTTSTQIRRNGGSIEILHPPDAIALSGVGGRAKCGKRYTSNSLSAAIRVSFGPKSSVLLASDIELDCVAGWKAREQQVSASVLVFPHHGGLPGISTETEARRFALELMEAIRPEVVIFSNHRTRFGNPRDEVLAAISEAASAQKILFACTQLPERLRKQIGVNPIWSLHEALGRKGVVDGAICLVFEEKRVRISFGEAPVPS